MIKYITIKIHVYSKVSRQNMENFCEIYANFLIGWLHFGVGVHVLILACALLFYMTWSLDVFLTSLLQ